MKNIRQFQIHSMRWRSTATAHSPHVSAGSSEELEVNNDFITAKHYSQVPGPKPWPIIGNTWRMLPVIGILVYIVILYLMSRIINCFSSSKL